MIPGFTWGLFPPHTPYLPPPNSHAKYLWYYGVALGPQGNQGIWPATEHALKDRGGGAWFSWSPASVPATPISSFRYHSPGGLSCELKNSKLESRRCRSPGSCWLCREGWNKELEAPPWPWGRAQVSRSSPREGVGKGLGEADLSA